MPATYNKPKNAGAKQEGANARRSKSAASKKTPSASSFPWKKFIGLFLLGWSLFLAIAFISYLKTWSSDLSRIQELSQGQLRDVAPESVQNWTGLLGATLAHRIIQGGFGWASFGLLYPMVLLGFRLLFGFWLSSFFRSLWNVFFWVIWLAIATSLVSSGKWSILAGSAGAYGAYWLRAWIGTPGTVMLLLFSAGSYLGAQFYENLMLRMQEWYYNRRDQWLAAKASLQERRKRIQARRKSASKEHPQEDKTPNGTDAPIQAAPKPEKTSEEPFSIGADEETTHQDLSEETHASPGESSHDEVDFEIAAPIPEGDVDRTSAPYTVDDLKPEGMEVEHIPQHEQQTEGASMEHVEDYDPTADLSNYQYPHLDLVEAYPELEHKSAVDRSELQERKNQIVETLNNYNIQIEKIKATVGPTITLYEIIPQAGTRISRIKNLEDDIALSLAALGIRIIAPIPGRGTIGIEVPNTHPDLVPMRSVLASNKFKQSEDALPIAMGKTISNEVYSFDLAKMPHLLMAGATGQGKSVGINVILTSLLYKKHPAQLKFVLVDPKKVELSLYRTIERHFLARLPNNEEAIITDTSQVVDTLNSLCVEMDHRYDLLKDAGVRNIKEYNQKFIRRKLNPEQGHRYLPYFVVVIDELADLMMTAGKEVEMPIARLAQLARAIGIHLVIATQRPSVNIITGTIKANFPARFAFRVTSKVDSRTILDAGGAEQLIGKGDMLLSTGSDLTRLQCAFLDTEEVEQICNFIGAQQGYQDAFLLPEAPGEAAEGQGDVAAEDLDPMFEEAARLIVTHQQGSTSLIQRKMKLGYNRAGRIMDQLEYAGVVGPNEGSKARQVLIPDEYALEQLLTSWR